jgi:hypothetical protein
MPKDIRDTNTVVVDEDSETEDTQEELAPDVAEALNPAKQIKSKKNGTDIDYGLQLELERIEEEEKELIETPSADGSSDEEY